MALVPTAQQGRKGGPGQVHGAGRLPPTPAAASSPGPKEHSPPSPGTFVFLLIEFSLHEGGSQVEAI